MRQGILKKIPITFILGDRELKEENISYKIFADSNTYMDSKEQAISLVKKLSKNPARDFKRKEK